MSLGAIRESACDSGETGRDGRGEETDRARAKKASSTLMLVFAEVSRYRNPNSSANSCPCSVVMTCIIVSFMSTLRKAVRSERSDLLVGPVALVADENLVDAFGSVLFDVGMPGSDV